MPKGGTAYGEKTPAQERAELFAAQARDKEVLPEFSYTDYRTGKYVPITRGHVYGYTGGIGGKSAQPKSPSQISAMKQTKKFHEGGPEVRAQMTADGYGARHNSGSLNILGEAALKTLAGGALAYGGQALLAGAGGAGGAAAAGSGAPVGGMAGATGSGAAATHAANVAAAGAAGAGGATNALAGSGAPVGGMAGSTGSGAAATHAGNVGNAMAGTTGAANALSNAGTSGAPDWLNPALIGGSSLISGYLSNQATDKGIDEIKRQYDQTRADMEPWRQSGIGALDKLNNFDINTITEDPMYQLANEEGLRAINRGNSARGLNLSGNALIDEARTGAAIASDYGNNVWNRQAGLAGVGQAATNNLASLGQGTANSLAGLYMQQGQGLNNSLQGGISNYLTYDMNKNYRNPYMSPYSQYYKQV